MAVPTVGRDASRQAERDGPSCFLDLVDGTLRDYIRQVDAQKAAAGRWPPLKLNSAVEFKSGSS